MTSYSIAPALPNGLSFDTATGVISGTPSVISATATYTVTAFNSGGSTSFAIDITINDIAPNTLSYPTPNVFTIGTAISSLNPTISGGAVTSYSISPALPNGLSFNTATGVIWTPTSISPSPTSRSATTWWFNFLEWHHSMTWRRVFEFNSPNVLLEELLFCLNPTILVEQYWL